jgi:transposase-like protein
MGTADEYRCPVCNSEAVYKYGHIRTGKQRLKCLMCGRQFILGVTRHELKSRPTCPQCGLKMHLYMHGERALRFRCSDYPECKTYQKIPLQKEVVA